MSLSEEQHMFELTEFGILKLVHRITDVQMESKGSEINDRVIKEMSKKRFFFIQHAELHPFILLMCILFVKLSNTAKKQAIGELNKRYVPTVVEEIAVSGNMAIEFRLDLETSTGKSSFDYSLCGLYPLIPENNIYHGCATGPISPWRS